METYSVAQVESLTGIKGHTLRVWERRYSFLETNRTETNIRYYTDYQLRLLLNISILNRNGIKISKIDRMSSEEIDKLVLELTYEDEAQTSNEISRLTLAMMEMNEVEFDKIFQLHVMRKGILVTIVEVIYPFLHHMGTLWTSNKAMPAQEHFVSNLIRQKIISAINALPPSDMDSKSIVMFLTEGEEHELGLLLASYIAKDLGWKVVYLGQNVPKENIITVCNKIEPDLLLTMFVSPLRKKNADSLLMIREHIDIPILLSGNPEHIRKEEFELKEVFHLSSPEALKEYLEEF